MEVPGQGQRQVGLGGGGVLCPLRRGAGDGVGPPCRRRAADPRRAAVALGDLADEPGGQPRLDGQGDARDAVRGGVDREPPAGVGPGLGEVAEPHPQEVPVRRAEAGAHRRGRGVDQHVDAAVLLLHRPGRARPVREHAVDEVRWNGDHELAPREQAEVALLVTGPHALL
ncbi:hypothetical protein [Actinomadura roseirufa]|uniref:hypothetical protein n=1 Tax=Actinomadura roseirufa TaxID=2094049 RepID=UPI001041B517|nr:hypothetical protein [Actinomadura roseirufa]